MKTSAAGLRAPLAQALSFRRVGRAAATRGPVRGEQEVTIHRRRGPTRTVSTLRSAEPAEYFRELNGHRALVRLPCVDFMHLPAVVSGAATLDVLAQEAGNGIEAPDEALHYPALERYPLPEGLVPRCTLFHYAPQPYMVGVHHNLDSSSHITH